MPEEKKDVACEFSPRLPAFFDGELSEAERLEVAVHAKRCPACAVELAAYAKVSEGLKGAWSPPVSRELMVRVRASFVRRPADALLHLAETLTAAAAVVLFASLVYMLAAAPESSEPRRYEPSLAAISAEMTEPSLANRTEEERLAGYILADLSTGGLE